MTDNPLASLYLKTEISIEDGDHMVPAAKSSLVREGVVHIITAWNPGEVRPSQEPNETADRNLFELLKMFELEIRRAVGADPDSDHFEESWAVSGLSDDEARAIGASFDQVAIFRLEGRSQTVLGCRDAWSLSREI